MNYIYCFIFLRSLWLHWLQTWMDQSIQIIFSGICFDSSLNSAFHCDTVTLCRQVVQQQLQTYILPAKTPKRTGASLAQSSSTALDLNPSGLAQITCPSLNKSLRLWEGLICQIWVTTPLWTVEGGGGSYPQLTSRRGHGGRAGVGKNRVNRE